MRVAAYLLAFVSSTLAYSITSPNTQTGWTNQGSQLLTWERVNTDKSTFDVVLDNQQKEGYTAKLIASNVDGTKGKVNLTPPSGGWPTGSDFRVNLVKNPGDFNTIYAQSSDFDIKKVATAAAAEPDSHAQGSGYDPTSEYAPASGDNSTPERSSTPGSAPSQGALTGSRPTGPPNSGSTSPYAATESTMPSVDNNNLPIIPNTANSNLRLSSGLLGLSLLLAFVLV